MAKLEKWAEEWLEAQRKAGKTGISVEKRGDTLQLRWQTTRWDKEEKKRKRESNYIGSLVFPGRVVLAKGLDVSGLDPRAREAFGLEVHEDVPTALCDQRISGPILLIDTVCGATFDKLRAAFGPDLADDLWMLSMGANYKLKFFQLLKNSFLMTFGLIFQNIFFAFLLAIPISLVLLGSFFQIIGIVILLLFGGKKIPELMRGLGKGVKSFKQGVDEAKEEISKAKEDIDQPVEKKQ